jgi:hypothetical protein
MFDVLSSLDRGARRIENFEINELVNSVAFRVALYESILMLVNAPDEIARDTDIQCATGATRKNIQIVLAHIEPCSMSWPGLSRPSRFKGHGVAFLSGIAGTSPAMTQGVILHLSIDRADEITDFLRHA